MDYAFIAVMSFFVSIGSSIAGGGGGFVMTPLMILVGFPAQTVLASQKAAGIGINTGAMTKFIRHKGVIHWKWAGVLSVAAIIASLIGTRIVFIFDTVTLERLVGLATLLLVPLIFFNRKIGKDTRVKSNIEKALGAFLYFVIMTFQAGLGAGIGTMLMFVLMGLMGLDALTANATRRASGFVLVATSFIIFIFSGYIDWLLAIIMGVTMFAGGYIGAHLAVKHGSGLVKNALVIVSIISALGVLVRSF